MGYLHLCGFEVHVQGAETDTEPLAPLGRAVRGEPSGGHIEDVENAQFTTRVIPLAEANALKDLSRRANGNVWHCDDSDRSTSGLQFSGGTPTFDAGTPKFGTHAITIAAAGGAAVFDITVSLGAKWTLAGFTKIGAGSYIHYIERSDGEFWTDGVQGAATPPWTTTATDWSLDSNASDITLFDDLVFFPFDIWDDWGADWLQTEAFCDLPRLLVYGDFMPGYQFESLIGARVKHTGKATVDGARQASGVTMIEVMGGPRSDRT